MPGDWKQALEARLADVPKGELLVCAKSDTLFFPPPACDRMTKVGWISGRCIPA